MAGFTYVLMWMAGLILTLGAWLTHVVTCLLVGSWGILIAGALLFPIGIIHGWLLWLGVA